jgi:hypothetical protein
LVEHGTLSLGVEYEGELINRLGQRSDVIAQYVWASLSFLSGIGFAVAAVLTHNYLLFLGILTTLIGFHIRRHCNTPIQDAG